MSIKLRGSTKAHKFKHKSKVPSTYSLALKHAVVNACKGGLSHAKAAIKFKIKHKSVVTNWCAMSEKGKILNDFNGRPPDMSNSDLASFCDVVNSSTEDNYAMKVSTAKKLMIEKIQENREKRGLDMEMHGEPSSKTISNIFRGIGAHCIVADATTTARCSSEGNVNNSIGFCAGISAIMRYIDSRMMGNVDASQFVYEQRLEKRVYCGKWKEYMATRLNIKGEPGEGLEGGLGFGIKYYCQIVSSGFMGDPIYIIADKHMPKDTIDVYHLEATS